MVSDFSSLSQERSIFDIHAEIAHGVLDLGVAQQDLDSSNVAGRPVNYRCLGPPQGMRAVFGFPQTDRGDPLVNKARGDGGARPAW